MAVLATFIGINNYADPQIRDLGGARRDATALWALFADTLPEAEARLLVDDEATVDEIRHAFDDTLGAAGPDDTVILSFSGHGTHDHRLVATDTALATLPATTIPMQELADRFKGTQAGTMLCVLDCCFSGGAPARVLEDSPTPGASASRSILSPARAGSSSPPRTSMRRPGSCQAPGTVS